MKYIKRDLIKAFTGFYSQGKTRSSSFPIATGNWGCGAFNGDRQLKGKYSFLMYIYIFLFKAIIQLMAASEAIRPLIYAAYGDRNLIESFSIVYDYLISQGATVRDLYRYLEKYCQVYQRWSLFDFILRTTVSSLRS